MSRETKQVGGGERSQQEDKTEARQTSKQREHRNRDEKMEAKRGKDFMSIKLAQDAFYIRPVPL